MSAEADIRMHTCCTSGEMDRRARFYVVQVPYGRERAAAGRLTRLLGDAVDEPLYQPTYIGERKSAGQWLPVERELLRGYVVAVTGAPEALEKAADALSVPCRVLCVGDVPTPLSPAEEALFGGLGRPGMRALPMSRGYKLADGRPLVTQGPLAGREHLIARVDRHKRIAELAVDVAGRKVRARAGLELAGVLTGDAAPAHRLLRGLVNGVCAASA